jgi:hypothetical protein
MHAARCGWHVTCASPTATIKISGTAAGRRLPIGASVRLLTCSDCELAVSHYPTFVYDASAGTGEGVVGDGCGDRVSVVFDVSTVDIPALSWRTARIFGVPLPPPLNIAIAATRLEVRARAAHFRVPVCYHFTTDSVTVVSNEQP